MNIKHGSESLQYKSKDYYNCGSAMPLSTVSSLYYMTLSNAALMNRRQVPLNTKAMREFPDILEDKANAPLSSY